MNTLQEAVSCGIIDLDEVKRQLLMTKRQTMLSRHPYAITLLPSGRWQTYFLRPSGKRLTVRAPSKEGLIDKLLSLYEGEDGRTLHELFEEWLSYKRQITNSPNTIKRHRQHYNKYFKNAKIFETKANDIRPLDLNGFCNGLVKDFNMRRSEWVNVKTILNGMFNYAVDANYISISPMSRVKITVKFKQVVKKSDGSKVFNYDEQKDFKEYLIDHFNETKDLSFLAVLLNFMLGLRIGELTALKWMDISDRSVHVTREETRNQEENVYQIEEHTKGYRARDVVLAPEAKKILHIIRHMYPFAKEDAFIFVRDGARLTSRQITYVYEKYAKDTGRAVKRSHTTRRTYVSNLDAAGVPIDEIRKQVGHSDIATTLGYIYSPLTEEATYERIVKAMS